MKRASLESANRWLNDPRILPFHHSEALDLGPLWNDCVVYEFPTGTVGFHKQPNGDWHSHLCLVPGAGNAKDYAAQALAAMFARDDCERVFGICKADNTRTARFGHGMGFQYIGRDGDSEVFVLTKQEFGNGVDSGNRRRGAGESGARRSG